jgi:integrase/recombinase XerC
LGVKNEIGDFLDYLTYERNVSPNTISAYRDDLESFTTFLCNDYFTLGRDQLDLTRVDHLTVRSYLAHLSRRKLARASVARHLSALRLRTSTSIPCAACCSQAKSLSEFEALTTTKKSFAAI